MAKKLVAADFIDRDARRVLTDDGKAGMPAESIKMRSRAKLDKDSTGLHDDAAISSNRP